MQIHPRSLNTEVVRPWCVFISYLKLFILHIMSHYGHYLYLDGIFCLLSLLLVFMTLYILTYSTLSCLFTCILLPSTAFCTCGWMLNCISLPQCSVNPVYSSVSPGNELWTYISRSSPSQPLHVCFPTKPLTDTRVGHERSRAASTNTPPLWCGVLNTWVCPFPALKHELLRGHSNKKEKRKKLAALQITGIHQFVCVEVSSIEVHS